MKKLDTDTDTDTDDEVAEAMKGQMVRYHEDVLPLTMDVPQPALTFEASRSSLSEGGRDGRGRGWMGPSGGGGGDLQALSRRQRFEWIAPHSRKHDADVMHELDERNKWIQRYGTWYLSPHARGIRKEPHDGESLRAWDEKVIIPMRDREYFSCQLNKLPPKEQNRVLEKLREMRGDGFVDRHDQNMSRLSLEHEERTKAVRNLRVARKYKIFLVENGITVPAWLQGTQVTRTDLNTMSWGGGVADDRERRERIAKLFDLKVEDHRRSPPRRGGRRGAHAGLDEEDDREMRRWGVLSRVVKNIVVDQNEVGHYTSLAEDNSNRAMHNYYNRITNTKAFGYIKEESQRQQMIIRKRSKKERFSVIANSAEAFSSGLRS